MRFRLREARPRNISEAEIIAVRIETHRLADRQRGKFLVRSVDTSHFHENTSRKLPIKNQSPTPSKYGNDRYPQNNKRNFNNVSFGVHGLRKELEEIKKEVKLCQEALNSKRSENAINKNSRHSENVKVPDSGARVR